MWRISRSLITIASVVVLLVTFGIQVSYGQGHAPAFPESHKDFLGASSYRALFGLNPGPVAPGPHSSDTGTGRPPRVGPNIQVNAAQVPFPGGLLGRSETSIAASGNGNFLVAGWNDAQGFCGPPFGVPCVPPAVQGLSGFAFSRDGGETWTDGGAPFVFGSPGVMTQGDPSLDVGGNGNDTFYYANLGVFVAGPFAPPFPASAGITVHSGSFSGKNFTWNNAVLLQSPNFPNDFLDKEHIAADKQGSSNNVYVSVTNFIEVAGIPFFGFGQIEAYSSTDGGQTFSRSIIQLDETVSVPLGTGVLNQGSQPAVGPDGTVYVAWERGWLFPLTGTPVTPEIRVAKSTDNGATWTPAAPAGPPPAAAGVLVSKICSGALFPPAGYNRSTTNDFPRIAVSQTGPHRGRVYVVYQDCRIANGGPQPAPLGPEDFLGVDLGHPDTDIYLSFSDDSGATWSSPTLAAGGPNIQFWPTVSVQPGGNVDVTYYESVEPSGTPFLGGGPGTSLVNLFWAQSIDGGATFETPVGVSSVTTDWGATATNIVPNFGDYNTAVSAGNRLFTTWADGRNGVPDTFFSKILTVGKAPR